MWGAVSAATILGAGCTSPFDAIDHRVNLLLAEGSTNVGGGTPRTQADGWPSTTPDMGADLNMERPGTFNPTAGEMTWNAMISTEADAIIRRLNGYTANASDATDEGMTLDNSLAWAVDHAFEYQFAEEEFVLSCLNLLVERHLWTPRVANDIRSQYNRFESDTAFVKSSSSIVNDLNVTQRLPWGGQVAANYLATFSNLVHGAGSTNTGSQDNAIGQFTLSTSIPFLRGAGAIAREDIIQAERNLIYAARTFEDFRRSFFVDVVRTYLSLQVQQQELENAMESVALLDRLADRQRALYDAGRARLYDAAEAENNALQQRSELAGLQESFRLAVDRFKILINFPVELPAEIERASFAIAPPQTALDAAVRTALVQRLDLQTRRDQLVDQRRAVRNALNGMLPDLNLAGSIRLGSSDEYYDQFILTSLEDMETEISLTLGLPLDRTQERLAVRSAQISLERARRSLTQERDQVAVNVRNAVRTIDSSLLSYDIQRRNVQIAKINIESIAADPDSYTVLDQLSSIQSLQRARNGRARAFRTVQQSILQYLLDTGQLRVTPNGGLQPLPGMVIDQTASLSFEPDAA